MERIKTVAFLGDSITMGYGLADTSKRFSTLVCEDLGVRELNYGITGTLIARAGVSRSDGTSFVDRMGAMEQADLAIVFGGTNDYNWSDADIEGGGAEHFRAALEQLCGGLTEKYGADRLLFITPYKQRGIGNYLGGASWNDGEKHPSDTPNYFGRKLEDYVNVIAEVCSSRNIQVLDLYRVSGIDPAHSDGDYSEYTLDGCHPNESGHRLIADFIKSIISAASRR